MPTYLYETVPPSPDIPSRRFEMRQSMRDAALVTDPETGYPVRRVPQATFYLAGVQRRVTAAPEVAGSCCGPGGGACHH